jgi:hypothetical protein
MFPGSSVEWASLSWGYGEAILLIIVVRGPPPLSQRYRHLNASAAGSAMAARKRLLTLKWDWRTWCSPRGGGASFIEHDLFGKPLRTFPDHALKPEIAE